MSILTCLFLFVVVLHFTRTRAAAAEITLAAGAARTDITPDPAMTNWVDGKPYDGVLDPLTLRGLVLSDGNTEFALICWDLIDATEECVIDVRRAVRGATGIPETHILVAASHTHSSPRSPFAGSTFPGRGSERLRAILGDPVFQAWGRRLPGRCADVLKRAQDRRQPVTLNIGRANVSEWLFNRRPLDPDGNVVTMFQPRDPHTLPDGLRFGSLDPTLTVLTLQNADNTNVATVYSAPCHPVSIYPYHRGVSADWPGLANERISEVLGGESFFLQGCAGDIVPATRGEQARTEMARFFAERAVAAARSSHRLPSSPLKVATGVVGLPLVSEKRKEAGADIRPVEIQVVVCGPFGLAVLPGEPLNGLAREIQARSPLPHTLAIGYANGRGVSYVGLPGEKARGGYEAGAGQGTEEAGDFMIQTALRLLAVSESQKKPAS